MEQLQVDKIKEITEELEKGILEVFETEKYKEYLNVMSKFHKYSFRNTLLISQQNPNATMVASFNSWQNNFKRSVKKGEKGIRILAPAPYKVTKDVEKIDPKTQKPILGKDGLPKKERVEVIKPGYKVVTVFDISQTHGEPLPELATMLPESDKDYEEILNAVKAISPVSIVIRPIKDGANGYYDFDEKIIAIKDGMSQAHTLKTAIHELSHAMLHDKDTGREKDNQLDRRTKEVQAESIAYTVCCHFGLDTSDFSFGYIAGWSSDKKLEELKESMATIRNTSSEIIDVIEKKLVEAKQEIKIDKLANDIDEFIRSYKNYEFKSVVYDVEKTLENIKAGKVGYLQECFKKISNENEIADVSEKAKKLSERLEEYSKEKTIKYVSQKRDYYRNENKTNDVAKYRHRSH